MVSAYIRAEISTPPLFHCLSLIIDNYWIFSENIFARRNRSLQPGLFTRLEMLHILSISDVLKSSGVNIKDPRTLIILSTPKGNIDLLEKDSYPAIEPDRIYLWKWGEFLGSFFKNPNKPLVVSNACISGLLAILIGSRLIKGRQV